MDVQLVFVCVLQTWTVVCCVSAVLRRAPCCALQMGVAGVCVVHFGVVPRARLVQSPSPRASWRPMTMITRSVNCWYTKL